MASIWKITLFGGNVVRTHYFRPNLWGNKYAWLGVGLGFARIWGICLFGQPLSLNSFQCQLIWYLAKGLEYL